MEHKGPCLRPNKVAEVKKLIRSHKISVIGVLETKVKVHKALPVQNKLGSNWCWHCNYDYSPKVGWGGM